MPPILNLRDWGSSVQMYRYQVRKETERKPSILLIYVTNLGEEQKERKYLEKKKTQCGHQRWSLMISDLKKIMLKM